MTGAGGFIGRALCPFLAAKGHRVVAGLRRPAPPIAAAEQRVLGEIVRGRDWTKILDGIDIVEDVGPVAPARDLTEHARFGGSDRRRRAAQPGDDAMAFRREEWA